MQNWYEEFHEVFKRILFDKGSPWRVIIIVIQAQESSWLKKLIIQLKSPLILIDLFQKIQREHS
jgi:hypothetical protein